MEFSVWSPEVQSVDEDDDDDDGDEGHKTEFCFLLINRHKVE